MGDYVRSEKDSENPDVRAARIRADLESLLFAAEPSILSGALDPFLDYVATKIASETASAQPHDATGGGALAPG